MLHVFDFAPHHGIRSARSLVSHVLDRRGGRAVLGTLATWFARRETADIAKVFYDGVWIQRFGDDFIATGTRFKFMHSQTHKALIERCADFWFYVYRPRRGDVIIDVGAGIGSDTLAFSRSVGQEGRVLSIEAHPGTFKLLENMVRWNGLSNVTPCRCAVVDKARPVFVEDREDHEFNSVSLEWAYGRRPGAVEGATLDDLCLRHGIDRVSFLKMNIEGAEALALEGMKRIIKRTEAICIACHDFLGDERAELRTRERVISFLEAHGFAIVTRDEDRRPYVRDHVHGYKPSQAARP